MSAPREVTAHAIAAAMGICKATILRRASRESWPYREDPHPGRPRRLYDVAGLPEDIRRAMAAGADSPPNAHPGHPGSQEAAHDDGGADGAAPAAPSAIDTMSQTVPPEDLLERRWQRLPEAARRFAAARLELVDEAVAAAAEGVSMHVACVRVSESHGSSPSVPTLMRWWQRVRDLPRPRRAMALADLRPGGTVTAPMDPAAWEAFKTDWLRPEQPALAACGRRLRRLAEVNGWTVPASDAALLRRVRREIPPESVVLARRGPEALGQTVPPQVRDRESLASMQAVNADGHTWDVRVRWPDGRTGRPVMVCWQDCRSGSILAWRIGCTETAGAYRLSMADLLWRHGAPVQPDGTPGHAILDNGRGIASKGLTGGSGAFRGNDRPGGPVGLLTELLGKENIHWTIPYSGQSKPIERAFGDFCKSIATDPRLAGAYTGKDTASKPSNYGSRAVPLERFLGVVADGIAQHNARRGRTGQGMGGRSFDEVFAANLGEVRKVPQWQLARWLLEPVAVTARKADGAVRVHGAVYWDPELRTALAGRSKEGRSVIVRCDPERLDRPVTVERPDGSLVAVAAARGKVPFISADAAKERGREKASLKRHAREQLAIHRSMSNADLSRMLDEVAAADGIPPEPAALPEVAASTPRKEFDPDELDRLNAAGDRNVIAALGRGGGVTP